MLYSTKGVMLPVFPRNKKKFALEELQKFVGGSIELIPRSKPNAYCNDEGVLDNLPVNAVASVIFGMELRGDVIQVRKVK